MSEKMQANSEKKVITNKLHKLDLEKEKLVKNMQMLGNVVARLTLEEEQSGKPNPTITDKRIRYIEVCDNITEVTNKINLLLKELEKYEHEN